MRTELVDADDVIGLSRRMVSNAFYSQTRHHQRHRDPTRLSMSGLGGCTRKAAYSLARTPASDRPEAEEGRAALLGTWLHEALLPVMAKQLGAGAVTEDPVVLHAAGIDIAGTLDLACDDPPIVWDLKTVREYKLEEVRRDGAYPEHWLQVMGYALARHQAGHTVRWVAWLYLDRGSGELHVVTEEFTPDAALAVIGRVEHLVALADDPDDAPRTERGPGLSFSCDRCPWLRRCWGPDARPGTTGAQRIIAETTAGIEYALALYAAALGVEGGARKDKEFAKAVLAGTPPDTYGDWVLSYGKPGTQLDQTTVKAQYAARGQDPPMTGKAPAISVKRVAQRTRT